MSRPARSSSSSIPRAGLPLPWRLALGLCLGALLGLGCGQGEGDRCEIDGDCKAGLRCVKSTEKASITSKICSSRAAPAAVDASEDVVVPSLDAGVDRAPGPDAAADAASDLPIDQALSDVRADGGAG